MNKVQGKTITNFNFGTGHRQKGKRKKKELAENGSPPFGET